MTRKEAEGDYKGCPLISFFHLIANDFNITNAAITAGIGNGNNPESSRTELHHIFARYGLTPKKIKENPEQFITNPYDLEFKVDYDDVIKFASKEIERYSELVNPLMLKKLIRKYASQIAERFIALTKEIFSESYFVYDKIKLNPYSRLTYKEAQEKFLTNYLKAQLQLSELDAKKAAEKSGINYDNFRQKLHKAGIKLREGEDIIRWKEEKLRQKEEKQERLYFERLENLYPNIQIHPVAEELWYKVRSGDNNAFNNILNIYRPLIREEANNPLFGMTQRERRECLNTALYETIMETEKYLSKGEVIKALRDKSIKRSREEAPSWITFKDTISVIREGATFRIER